jgi:hypothetical protein
MPGRSITYVRAPGGSVCIEGQDVGAAVGSIMGGGFSEYEWSWTIAKAEVPAAIAALGGKPGSDVIGLLRRWETSYRGQDPGQFLKDAGVRMDFWSRFGD